MLKNTTSTPSPRCFGYPDEAIIGSFLDTDFYEFTMGQLFWKHYQGVRIRMNMILRTKGVNLAAHIDKGELVEHIRACQQNRLRPNERQFLGGTYQYGGRMFADEYMDALEGVRLPDPEIEFRADELHISVEGHVLNTSWWEELLLEIVNELYYRSLTKHLTRMERHQVLSRGIDLATEKVKQLKALRAQFDFTISDFGSRRRFSRAWQETLNDYHLEELVEGFPEGAVNGNPFFRGTSNVRIAMRNGVMPMGTIGHKADMVEAALARGNPELLAGAKRRVLDRWSALYGNGLSLVLPDTFGSDHTFSVITPEEAAAWTGFRQDSDTPSAFTKKMLRFYEKHGVDARKKLVVPSDGQVISTMEDFLREFDGKTQISFGWGTNNTNDLGFAPLSLVVKVVEVNGWPAVKLSDNPKKHLGPAEEVALYQKVFGYHAGATQETVY